MEAWGASGGKGGCRPEDNELGYGGYSVGVFENQKNEAYINIGGEGGAATDSGGGVAGYNGGGKGGKSTDSSYLIRSGGGGGGATHIATTSGVLNKLESRKNSITIVSGGGGGSTNGCGTTDQYVAGSGGGISGSNSKRSVVNTGEGMESSGASQTLGFAFGQGQDGIDKQIGGSAGCEGNGGGGGGYYGGFSIQRDAGSTNSAGGGGSGYIGNSSLISGAGITKHMYGYNVPTSNDVNTRTITGTCANATPTADCAKIGNGYARVTWLGDKI